MAVEAGQIDKNIEIKLLINFSIEKGTLCMYKYIEIIVL